MKNYLFLVALFIVGCTASLNVTYDKDMFVAVYSHTTVYKTYVVGVSVSTLAVQQAFHNITLSRDETWSTSCLEVVLSNPLPDFLDKYLPSAFLDLRVFYRVEPTGKACTMEAKLCPDGTAVGRTGINCDFAPCPGDSFCVDDVAMCADGSQVGRTGESCTFECPDADPSSIRAQNYTQILAILNAYTNLYQNNYPYSTYVYAAHEATLSEVGADSLYNDETWDSYCIKVMLLNSPPSDIDFPDVYLGARVFYYIDACEQNGSCDDSAGIIILNSFVILLAFTACFALCCCCIRRKRRCACKANQANGFQRLPVEDPQPVQVPVMMAPMMMPEFDVEMMNGEQIPYEAMMVPVGYPPMYGYPQQPMWFAPPPQQPQQE